MLDADSGRNMVEGEEALEPVSEEEVIEVYHKILFASHISVQTKQYGLMSLTKLSTRFPNATPKIQEIIDAFGSHMQVRTKGLILLCVFVIKNFMLFFPSSID